MHRTLIKDLNDKIGETVKVQGFVTAVRDQKRVQFNSAGISGSVQVVIDKLSENHINDQVKMLTEGSTVTFVGKLVSAPNVKMGAELKFKLRPRSSQYCRDPAPNSRKLEF